MKNLIKLLRANLFIFRLYLLLAIISSIFYISYASVPSWIVFSTLLMYFVFGCLGVVVMFHRKLTHHSYQTSKFVERLFSFFGVLGGTGSSIAWVNMHVIHHKYSDTPKDPHSPSNGLLNMFLLNYRVPQELTKPAKSLILDKYHLFLHKYYNLIHTVTGLGLATLFGLDVLFGFYVLPMILTATMSNFVNYLGHSHGYRNYATKDTSTNNLLSAFLSFGEGWHNNHHKHPSLANFGGRNWWEFDLSYQVIRLIQK